MPRSRPASTCIPAGAGGGGTRLYGALIARLQEEDVHLAVDGVAQPNEVSNALHRKLGFEEVGTFKDYARKRGAWISSTWFQRRMDDV